MKKLEWWGYLMVKKIEDIYNGLDTILTCDRRMDGHLAMAYTRYAYASRSKNQFFHRVRCESAINHD